MRPTPRPGRRRFLPVLLAALAVVGSLAAGFAQGTGTPPTARETHFDTSASPDVPADVAHPQLSKIDLDVGRSPFQPTYDPENDEFYVPGSGGNTVSVISGESVAANLTVGTEPMFTVYDGEDQEIYVSNSGSSSVSVIAGTTVVATIPVGSDPSQPAFDPADGLVYVPNALSGNISILHGSSLTATVKTTQDDVAAYYDSADSEVYVLNTAANNVTVLSGTSIVGSVKVGADPTAAVFDSTNGELYVANSGSDTVSVLKGRSVAATVSVGSGPQAMAFDNYTQRVYVPDISGNAVTVINGTTVVGTVKVGDSPGFAAYDPVDGNIYVANQQSNDVSIFNGSHDGPVGTVPVGVFPQAIAVDALSGAVAVTNYDTDNVSLFLIPSFLVQVTETGLPSGTPWAVALGRWALSSTTEIAAADLPNGTYGFSLGAVANYTGSPQTGIFSVDGQAVYLSVNYSELFPVTFSESGLPAGENWTVGVGSGSTTSSGASIAFARPNGTYTFTANSTGYSADPSSGQVTVSGRAPPAENVVFAVILPPTYPVTFAATGLPSGALWSVTVDGSTARSTNSTIDFAISNGSFDYAVGAPGGFAATPSTGVLVLNGSGATVSIAFLPRPVGEFAITFVAAGLAAGVSWSVALGGATGTSTVGLVVFTEPNGSYDFSVPSVSGFGVSPSAGTVLVNGTGRTVALTFSPIASPPPAKSGFAALSPLEYVGIEAGAVAVVIALLAWRRRKQ